MIDYVGWAIREHDLILEVEIAGELAGWRIPLADLGDAIKAAQEATQRRSDDLTVKYPRDLTPLCGQPEGTQSMDKTERNKVVTEFLSAGKHEIVNLRFVAERVILMMKNDGYIFPDNVVEMMVEEALEAIKQTMAETAVRERRLHAMDKQGD